MKQFSELLANPSQFAKNAVTKTHRAAELVDLADQVQYAGVTV